MSNKKNTFVNNIVFTFATKIIILFGSFFTSVLIARLIGPEGKGIITSVFAVPNIVISLAYLGVSQSVVYFIGSKKYLEEEIIKSLMFLWFIATFLSFLVVGGYFYFVMRDDYSDLILLLAVSFIPLALLKQYLSGVFRGKELFSIFNKSHIIELVAHFVGILLLVWALNLGVIGAFIARLFFIAIVLSYLMISLFRYTDLRLSKGRVSKKLTSNIFNMGIQFAIAQFILTLNYKIDIVILERFVSSSEVGIYAVGTSIAELIWQLPAAIGLVLFARSANTKNTLDSIKRSTTLLRITLPIITIFSGIIFLISPILIKYLYGIEFIESASVVQWLLPGVVFLVISKILHPDLAGRGFPLFALWVFIFPLILNILLNIYLIPKMGINGAALASTISYLLGGLLFSIAYSKKEKVKLIDLIIINKEDIKLISKHVKKYLKK